MIKKLTSFLVHCRLEDVMAAGVSISLTIFFLSERAHHTFPLNVHDIAFIMLPAGILALKYLLGTLFACDEDEEVGTQNYVASFFRPLLEIFHDWFPFLVLSACYYALYSNLILRVTQQHTADATLARIDAIILGGHQPSFLLEAWINPWLTDFFNAVYFSHVLLLPSVALYFYVKKKKLIFRRLMMGYLTLMLMGITSYLLVPANGPITHFATQYTTDLRGHMLSHSVDYVILAGRVGFDCFPSLHVGIPLLLSFYIRDYRRKLFPLMLLYVATMCLATIYLRYHYLIDVLVAFLFAPVAYWLNDFLLARWPGERIVAAKPTPNNIVLPDVVPS